MHGSTSIHGSHVKCHAKKKQQCGSRAGQVLAFRTNLLTDGRIRVSVRQWSGIV